MNEQQNPQNSSPNNKWIAPSIAALALLTLSGGIYQWVKHHRGSTANTGAANHAPETQSGVAPSAVDHSQGTASVTPAKAISKHMAAAGAPAAPGGATLPALPGGPSLPAVAPQAAPMPGALPVAEKVDQCVTITYRHKALASHPDEESCSHHKNLLKLALPTEGRINPASVCVRVNGTPVHYLTVKGHADELLFGSVAGPKSKVTVRYCTGKAVACAKEDCTVPKDEFMEAIGGSDGGTQDAKLGQWDPTAPPSTEADVMAKLDGSVKKELETNDDLNGRAPAGELFKDWIGQTETTACGSAQAKN